jgi:hypothetical protein
MKIYDADRLMDEFYTSVHYDPLAESTQDYVQYAIDFMIERLGDDITLLARCAQELSENGHDRDGLSNETEITLDLVHEILKEY